MDLNGIWNSFLSKIQNNLSPMSFETWFMDTKLINLDDGIAKIEVPMHIHKNHLKNNYNDLIDEIFTDVTGTNFKFEFYTKEELEEQKEHPNINRIIETQMNELPIETNLNSQYTFENFFVG